MAVKNTKRDRFNRTGQKSGLVRLPTNRVKGAMSLERGATITLEDVEEEDIFPEAEGNVVFDPEDATIVKDPAEYGKPKQQGYGDVVFDPN